MSEILELVNRIGSPMRVTILGSGTNLHPRRAAAGYLVKTDQNFLMDFGPRTLSNLLKTTVNHHQIQYLFFTHYHADHFSDFITFSLMRSVIQNLSGLAPI